MNLDWLLAGIETEYGLLVEGRGADTQIDDSMALVRGYPGESFVGWDYRFESPRNDLRGFRLDRLEFDPEDAKFDQDRPTRPDSDVRSDRVLPNGARFYNDHGHPEYATPESHSLDRLARLDLEGERLVHAAGQAYAEATGASVRLFKNNTDFHGASYGTHESYLAPRSLGFEGLYETVLPMLVVRQVLCGAGKAGEFAGPVAKVLGAVGLGGEARDFPFQISQRADFFVEPFNAETLYRRPIFNTRDEPHADPRDWMRLHVICGDANRIPSATRRKVGLVQLALALAAAGKAPRWALRNPVEAFKKLSRVGATWISTDEDGWQRLVAGRESPLALELEGGSWTTPEHVLESYFTAGERFLDLGPDSTGIRGELAQVIAECRRLLSDMVDCRDRFRRHVDWAAKAHLFAQYVQSEGLSWNDPVLQAVDLEYSDIDPESGLFAHLVELGEVEAAVSGTVEPEPNRAFARGLATTRFAVNLVGVSWAALTFELDGRCVEVHLDPTRRYGPELAEIRDVTTFVSRLQEIAS